MDFEEDPAADFLNREREELGGIINDGEGLSKNEIISNQV